MFYSEKLNSKFMEKVATESDYFSILMWIEHYGGIAALLKTISQHGLHNSVASWLEKGENFTLYPEQILSIINTDELDNLAIECNTDLPGAAQLLASTFPRLVNGLSIKGKLQTSLDHDFCAEGIDILCGH